MNKELLKKIYWLVKYIQNHGGTSPFYHVIVDKNKIDKIIPEIEKCITSQFGRREISGCLECNRVNGSHHSGCSQYQERH